MDIQKVPLAVPEGEQGAPRGHSASEDARGGAAAPRLDKKTHLNRQEEGRLIATLRDYGGGLVEIGWAFVGAQSVKKAAKGQSENTLLHADRAARRARSRLRQLILASGCDHLLTLTYRKNMGDFDQASSDLKRFVRKVRHSIPGWLYVGVPEKQKRGAWHWHLAVKGRQDVALLRSHWLSVIGDGNIDVQPPKRGTENRRLAIVSYLGKYLSKGFSEDHRELNRRRFRASHGIKVPLTQIPVPPEQRERASAYLLDQLRLHAGSVGHVWVHQQLLAGWACSWE